jgi:ankyrin repeat protein
LNLAKLIRKHLLTREASRKFHEPPNAGPGYFLNQALKKQIEDVREKLDRTEEILALMRKACDLDIEGVITCLDNGVRPFTSGPGLAKLSISPLTLSRDGGFAWQPTASWAWHPWGHMDRPHATAELLRLLVAEGMEVDFPRLFGVTPLCAAVEADRVDILEWLVKRGANVNAEGAVQKSLPGGRVGYHLTALDYAVALGKRASMRYLLGLPVVAVSHTFCITQSGTIPEVDFASGRVDISDKRVVSGVTALHFADTYAAPRLLKGRTSLMHARDSHGRAPFHWAVEEGDVSRTQFLLNEGYPVDCPDGQGATGLALICAAHERGLKRTGYPEIVRLLLMRGADVEMRYPKELSIRSRFWMMQDWRGVYEGIFDEFGLLRKCLEEELERVVRWSGLERAEEGRMVM